MRRKILLGTAMVVTAVAMVVIIARFVDLAADPREAVKVRNAWLATSGGEADFVWGPREIPAGFKSEPSRGPLLFREAVQRIMKEGGEGESEFQKALRIASHLVQGPKRGEPIQKNTQDAYLTIVGEGGGYCSDFAQVFNGLAIAAGIPVREWGFSFDGFGAGHGFNEVYDSELSKWVMIDSFYSFYVTDTASGEPLSALELWERLRGSERPGDVTVVPIVPSEFAFPSAEAALTYYREGADQVFLWWGNNVFAYDSHPLVKMAGRVSRMVEQVMAIVSGVHPGIRILRTPTNRGEIERLHEKELTVAWMVSALIVLTGLLIALGVTYWRVSKGAGPGSRRDSDEVLPIGAGKPGRG
jgi:hypothetical protein